MRGFDSLEVGKALVEDLVIFQKMFRNEIESNSPQVLYRDAIPANYLDSKDEIIHIDFSSSNKIVHSLDDLALLLCPAWNNLKNSEITELVETYKKLQDEITVETDLFETTSKLPRCDESYYINQIRDMQSAGIRICNLDKYVSNVNFKELDMQDFEFFAEYRRLRANYYLQKKWV